MNSINRHQFGNFPNLLYYGAIHMSKQSLQDPEYCKSIIVQDCTDSGISAEEFANSQLVVKFLAEGHDEHDIKTLTDYLQTTHRGRFMVLFNSAVDVSKLDYHAVSIDDFLIKGNHTWDTAQHFTFDNISLNKKFLCLMRRPSVSRAQLGKFLINSVGLENTLMSFGSGSLVGLKGFQQYFHGHDLPILIDGVVSHGNMFYDMVYKPEFYSCMFNIIAESSSQSDEFVYKSVFLTEKTFKAVIQHQFPIWYGVPGLVQQVRHMGFDVFDDLFDNHLYDLIQDESQRYQQVFDLIQKINRTYSSHTAAELRQTHQHRLAANFEHFKSLEKMVVPKIKQYILEFYNKQGTP